MGLVNIPHDPPGAPRRVISAVVPSHEAQMGDPAHPEHAQMALKAAVKLARFIAGPAEQVALYHARPHQFYAFWDEMEATCVAELRQTVAEWEGYLNPNPNINPNINPYITGPGGRHDGESPMS